MGRAPVDRTATGGPSSATMTPGRRASLKPRASQMGDSRERPALLADLIPDPANRRVHSERNLAMVREALETVGTARSIVIDETNTILAGNGVTAAATAAGLTKVRIVESDGDEVIAVRRRGLTDEQKRALALYDNRTAELATWNIDQLAADLRDGLDLAPFFFEGELKTLFGSSAVVAGRTDPDAVPDERSTDIRPGDLFDLGPHRLLCGDATGLQDVATVAGSTPVQLVFTSPPYAEQRSEQYGGIPATSYVTWFGQVEAAVRPVVSPRGHVVINIKPHATDCQRDLYVSDLVTWLVRAAGWLFVDEFVWLRTGIPQQVTHRFKNAFEPVYWFAKTPDYAWYPETVRHASDDVPIALGSGAGDTNAARRQGKGGGAIQGNTIAPGLAYPSNVLDFKQNAPALGHPAAFPVQLPSFFVQCMSQTGEVVLDPFVGSGTTIMACEMLERRGVAIDRSPAYCQITIDRWEAFTGQKAVKVGGA